MEKSEQNYDVKHLAEFIKRAKRDGKPYIFFTGAGCSKSAGIPLANELVSEMHTRFALELTPLKGSAKWDYGKCMARIGRDDRRRFLKEYTSKAKINWAHIALACLLREGYISRVLTFNFDNLLARSCGLLGLYPATYDLTSANSNLYHLIDNPAIVHLHGQSNGFAQLNSDSETGVHAEQLDTFIRDTLNESPALFIGYSGKNDAMFPKVVKNYTGEHRLFWLGMQSETPEHVSDSILSTGLAHYMSCSEGADLFLIELAQNLNCFPPLVFSAPYKHLLNELHSVSDFPIKDNQSSDILLGIKRELELSHSRSRLKEGASIMELYLSGCHNDVIERAVTVNELTKEEEIIVSKSFWRLISVEWNDNSKMLIEQFDGLLGASKSIEVHENLANALFERTYSNDLDMATIYLDDIIRRYDSKQEDVFKEIVARAYCEKAHYYRFDDKAVGMLNLAITTLESIESEVANEIVNQCLIIKAMLFAFQEHYDDSRDVFTHLKERVENNVGYSSFSEILRKINLYIKESNDFGGWRDLSCEMGVDLFSMSSDAWRDLSCEMGMDLFGKSNDRQVVTQLLFLRLSSIHPFNLTQEEEIAAYDEIILINERYKDRDVELDQVLARALINKGDILRNQELFNEALSVCKKAEQLSKSLCNEDHYSELLKLRRLAEALETQTTS